MTALADEPVYTLRQVGKMLQVSDKTALKLFENATGTIVIESPETMHKRRYRTFRVPRHVYERVVRSLSNR